MTGVLKPWAMTDHEAIETLQQMATTMRVVLADKPIRWYAELVAKQLSAIQHATRHLQATQPPQLFDNEGKQPDDVAKDR